MLSFLGAVLSPAGPIAHAELTLMGNAMVLMLITAIAVFSLLFFFAWYYRASNTKAVYLPDWEHGTMSELVWWAIPIEIVLVLGALTWTSTHELDPHKALAAEGAPVTIEVVALPWKWLFIYPNEGVATVNTLTIPVNRPINLKITADAPMNSLWIPELGGQIYAMTGMVTELHLLAEKAGTFEGSSSNYSGEGFAGMHFAVQAVPDTAFLAWIKTVKSSGHALTNATYATLRAPSGDEPPAEYALTAPHLFENIMQQFMGPMSDMPSTAAHAHH